MKGQIELLMDTAIAVFNSQYKSKHKVQDFLIKSIPPNANTDRGYELWTRRQDDDFVIRLYCYFGDYTRVFNYTLKPTLDSNNTPSDKRIYECYVMTSERYPIVYNYIISEDGTMALSTENGEYLVPENAE